MLAPVRRAVVTLAAMLAASLVAASPAAAEPAVALTPNNSLLLFDTDSPATTTSRPVTGLGIGETLRGIDQRPSSLELYGSTVSSGSAANSVITTYAIDPATGAATLIGATAAALAGAADIPTGFDFNPVVDRLRYVNTNDESARLNPNNGALAGNDTDLSPAATTDVIAEAYDRNVKDAELTTLFAIDRNGSTLSLQGGANGVPSPNGGVVTDVGPLGITLAAGVDGGFDISRSGTAYAGLNSSGDPFTRLYTINLTTGAATARGFIANGMLEVRSLTILSARPLAVAAPSLPPVVPPPTIPPPAPVMPDTSPPNGLIGYLPPMRSATLLRSGLSAEVACSEACKISARLKLGKITLATGSAALSGAGVRRVKLKATSRIRRKGLPKGVTKAEVVATLTDGAGNKTTYGRRVSLR